MELGLSGTPRLSLTRKVLLLNSSDVQVLPQVVSGTGPLKVTLCSEVSYSNESSAVYSEPPFHERATSRSIPIPAEILASISTSISVIVAPFGTLRSKL